MIGAMAVTTQTKFLAVILGVMAPIGSACQVPPGPTGSVVVVARVLQASGIGNVQVTVQGSKLPTAISRTLLQAGNQFSAQIDGLPAATDYTFSASAASAATPSVVLLHGSVSGQVITNGRTANIIINLNTVTPGQPFKNSAPVIDTVSATSLIAVPGEKIGFQATAHDPDKGETALLVFNWSATCGTIGNPTLTVGSDTTNSKSAAEFTAPDADANCSVTLAVADPRGLTASIALNVAVRVGRGGSDVVLVFDSAPIMLGLFAIPGQLTEGGATALTVVASDPDGDPLNYAWTSACPGTFTPPDAESTTFELEPSPAASSCTFSALVSDGSFPNGQAKNRVANQLTVAVANTVITGPPEFGIAYQSEDVVSDGDVVELAVFVSDPAKGEISLSWTASADPAPVTFDPAAIGLDASTFTTAATWTAPSGAATGDLVIVTVTATSSVSSFSSSYTFLLTPAGSTCATQQIQCPAGQICDPRSGQCVDLSFLQ
jgi:hypothetical protein